MNKPLLLIQAPVGTQSGYGHHSRDIALAFIRSDRYNVKIFTVLIFVELNAGFTMDRSRLHLSPLAKNI